MDLRHVAQATARERQTLIPISDDATKRVLYAQLVAAESTATIMAALWSVLVTHGLPQALYSDRASWAFYTPKAGQRLAKDVLTQVGRALARLGIEHKHVAVVALARRLAGILYALLRDGTVYTPRRPAALPDPVAALHA